MRDRKKKEDKERIDPEKENESLPELLTGPSLIVEEKGEGENKEVEELKKKLEEKEKRGNEQQGAEDPLTVHNLAVRLPA